MPTATAPEQFLRQVPLFHSLSAADCAAVLAACERCEAYAGELLITEGTPGSALYIIERG